MKWSILLGCLVFSAYGILNMSFAQENGGRSAIEGPDQGFLGAPVEMNTDLRDLPIEEILLQREPIDVPLRRAPSPSKAPLIPGSDENRFVPEKWVDLFKVKLPEFSTPNPNFEGISRFSPGIARVPPDPNGDVGPNHYVQIVNSKFMIFDKQGNTLAGPISIPSLFDPLGDQCSLSLIIDPIVNYDPLADRWLVMGFSQFDPGLICIAVSQTSDPVAGGWFLYDLDVSAFGFPDYPKLGVWPDAYYLTTQRGFHGGGLDVYALDRASMLTGGLATFVHFFLVPASGFLLPADLDGRPPRGTDVPVVDLSKRPPRMSTPAPFVGHVDGDLWGGVDRLEVFEFSVNFEDPDSSTFNLVVDLPTEPFNAVLCGDIFFGNCAEQPNGVRLETLPAWLMWRLQYRNFGAYETLVTNHTIDVDEVSDQRAGIRWYELRRYRGKQWTIFQQGTFAPQAPDATSFLHRFMGSIAMDKFGNMVLGFSASSSTVFPSVRYVGRLRNDPLGLMPRGGPPDGDFTMAAGEGSQFGTRWGDYSSMSIDPVDGCTFWYTAEYLLADGAEGNWRTRIGAFKLPPCRSLKIAGQGVE